MTNIMLVSPHRFPERLLIIGGGGAGKSTAVLTMARYMPYAAFHVCDTDISFTYDRLLATEFTDVDKAGNVNVHKIITWDDYANAMDKIVATGDHDKDVLVNDDVTWCWTEVQSWFSDQVHGEELGEHMLKLRQETLGTKDDKGNDISLKAFNAALTNDMTWPLINKVYYRKVYSRLHRWNGHFVLTASVAKPGERDDPETKIVFGAYGVKPQGQKDLHRIAATTILLKKRDHTHWTMTVCKDRGRKSPENLPVGDASEDGGFAIDYLQNVAGWQRKPILKKNQKEGE